MPWRGQSPTVTRCFFTTNSTHSAANGLFKSVPYDPIKDFTPIARIGSFPSFVAVNRGDCRSNSIVDLVAYAKANPGKLSYGVGNSTGHIVGETIKKRTGTDIVRVDYRSNPAAVTDLVAGHIRWGSRISTPACRNSRRRRSARSRC